MLEILNDVQYTIREQMHARNDVFNNDFETRMIRSGRLSGRRSGSLNLKLGPSFIQTRDSGTNVFHLRKSQASVARPSKTTKMYKTGFGKSRLNQSVISAS